MTIKAFSGLALAGVAMAGFALPVTAQAQIAEPAPMSVAEVDALPAEYRTAPTITDLTETTVDADGIETITRTRRIESTAPYSTEYEQYRADDRYAYRAIPASGNSYGYAPPASVFERDQWIAECERRTNGRDDREKGGIIGGLLGAIAGGIIGNRVADADRLAGTLIGAGAGGIGGVLLGSLIGGGRNDRGDYDCEAALDSYLSQHGNIGPRYAYRTIPAPAPAYPAYAPPAPYGYGYGYAPAYQYSYAPPQQIVYVPVRYEQQQRVIVRETVREEVIPGAARTIPAPAPQPRPVPRPNPPRYIKGN
ncbi:hypothetical protein CD351_02020 [Erythrobacter sp. KY5]|uniref:hypothetical protein n=1 Tax=Erythrobacter sp. KY5 TaxID=2011159 RepID=UPI000DBF1435|nr:hypothetical protein [Erythrobacter sp. KY5]AWW73198.1 hypothetical protein CD351_02020 [Erythrobacter sp. KY5]